MHIPTCETNELNIISFEDALLNESGAGSIL